MEDYTGVIFTVVAVTFFALFFFTVPGCVENTMRNYNQCIANASRTEIAMLCQHL